MSALDMPETEDFVEVVELGDYDYSWSILRAWYSPRRGRFYWLSDSGCSCYSFGQFASFGDLEDGDKAALKNAVRAFGPSLDKGLSAYETIEAFKPSEVPAW